MSRSSPSPDNNRRTLWLGSVSQLMVLIVLWFLADRTARMLGIPLSGGILGLIILVILLLTGLVKPHWIEGGADLILANMLLYFIPLVVSVVQYIALFQTLGIKLILTIGSGFVSVLLVTALIVDRICLLIRRRHLQKLRKLRKARNAIQR